jgi:hypothetical protein
LTPADTAKNEKRAAEMAKAEKSAVPPTMPVNH